MSTITVIFLMLFFFLSQQTKLKSVKQECKIINKMQVNSIRNLSR